MKAIIGIGLPGCGKTTLLKPLAQAEGLAYVNAEDIREELTGDPRNHTREVQVWRVAYERIKAGLQGRGVVIDATHSKRKDRVRTVSFCRQNGARQIIGYWLQAPVETCLERNRKRQREVREEAIHKMQRRLLENPPGTDEGFDEIVLAQTV